jgi:hypothetical protein
MNYTIGKYDNSTIIPVGTLKVIDSTISVETKDTFLKSYLEECLDEGIKLTYCVKGDNGQTGMRERLVNPGEKEFIPAVHRNFPSGYCMADIIKPEQHRKTP